MHIAGQLEMLCLEMRNLNWINLALSRGCPPSPESNPDHQLLGAVPEIILWGCVDGRICLTPPPPTIPRTHQISRPPTTRTLQECNHRTTRTSSPYPGHSMLQTPTPGGRNSVCHPPTLPHPP
jgi:hypothetical protein